MLVSSYQEVLAYDNKTGNDQFYVDSSKKYFLPRVTITNYNIKLMESICNQPINNSIK